MKVKNEIKKTVSEARTQVFEGLYKSLGTKEISKGREIKTRDFKFK